MAKSDLATEDFRANDRLVDYNCKKATQALNYLLQKSNSHSLHKLVLVKLLWAADRYHLRSYGRLIVDEPYVAMGNGPVGSLAKDIIYEKTDYNLPEECLPYTSSYLKKSDDGETVKSFKATDTDYLAETDVEALNFAWSHFGNMTSDEIVEFAHGYPEWEKHAKDLNSDSIKVRAIDLADFYKEPEGVKHDPFAIDEDLKNLNKRIFTESAEIRALLRR